MKLPGFHLSDKALRTHEQPINFLLTAAVGKPNVISLAAGLIDYDSLPLQEVQALACRILGDSKAGRTALQYGTTAGLADLREAMLLHFCKLEACNPGDLSLTPDNCVITAGSQQALYIIGDILLNPGDIVIAAAPTYYVYSSTLTSLGARVYSVPMDEDGLRIDLLEELLLRLERQGQLDRVKMIYEVTYYQNPTGVSLSTERRKQLVDVARRFSRNHRILVLDDAAYRELRYDGPTWPSLKAFDPDNQFTAVCMTFSKCLAAGLKTGYAFLPDDLVDAVLRQKGNHDFGSGNFAQHIIYRAVREGVYDQHSRMLCDTYRAKRDAMLEALDKHLGDLKPAAHWLRPSGGMYVWLTLPESIHTGRDQWLFRRCVEKGVLYVPGEYCYVPCPDCKPIPQNQMRLSFGTQNPSSIREGVCRLAEAIHEALDAPRGVASAGRSQPTV